MKKAIMNLFKFIFFACLLFVFSVFLINFYVIRIGSSHIYSDDKLPKTSHALVFGASVYGNNVSGTLAKRLDKAVEIYKMNKVDSIIVSGDHGEADYNEVSAMKEYLVKKGVPEDCICMDHSGFETYDSVLNAKELFNVTEVTLISQKVHIIRALYIARKSGITAYGIPCGNYTGDELEHQQKREFLARIKAFIRCDLKYNEI